MNKKLKDDVQLTPIEELIKEDFGAEGTAERAAFETGVDAFILGERLKEERKKSGLTQAQLAAKIGTKKSYISRLKVLSLKVCKYSFYSILSFHSFLFSLSSF